MKKQTPENISGKVNETNKEELEANESGELRQVNSSRNSAPRRLPLLPMQPLMKLMISSRFPNLSTFGSVEDEHALGFLAKRQSLVMQDLDPSIAVESDLDDEDILDLGLQRIEIDLSDEIRAQLEEGSQSLVWYRRPANADPFIYTYDEVTGTGHCWRTPIQPNAVRIFWPSMCLMEPVVMMTAW